MRRNILKTYTGLDLYTALPRIRADFPGLEDDGVEIVYRESMAAPRFSVLSCSFTDAARRRIRIEAASANPIRHLPSNYQENSFLRGFLMIFQHIMNETALKLDNLHSYFRPAECPFSFLPVLADWLGLGGETFGSEGELRRSLISAVSLYRLRGTALGMRIRLGLACGIAPRIIEGELPHRALVISDENSVEARVLEAQSAGGCFTVYFPVPRERFAEDLIRRLALIAGREKPAFMKCFIAFAQPPGKKRKTMTISRETFLDAGGGFFI
ncbi:MAG: phage tail protein [Spirochaetales bacterium]|nr:phage tail protein [Spirochaetales bacterium]